MCLSIFVSIIYTFATLFSTYHQVSFETHTTNRDTMRNIFEASRKSIDFQNKQTSGQYEDTNDVGCETLLLLKRMVLFTICTRRYI